MRHEKVGTKIDEATNDETDKELLRRIDYRLEYLMHWRHQDRKRVTINHRQLIARCDRVDEELDRVAQRLRQIEYALANVSQEIDKASLRHAHQEDE